MPIRCDRRIVFDIDPETGEVIEFEYEIGKKPPPLIKPMIKKKKDKEDGKEKAN